MTTRLLDRQVRLLEYLTSSGAIFGDENAPRRGEAEQGVIENEAERTAEQEQRSLPPAIGIAKRYISYSIG